ncbi:hypothetical protein K458DRAFT_453201 [Lentithecium fluviatile CBS 122367]|uniref:RING-type domain-containing protein n=1 Tax=Lentithecium fluviatile CBS 122367 TaxID=1168545 RepID=A0A6G1IXT3_9PLEO|nr:hypothetical protein K458DRAFT_453201 [Lentithecium fluviatile CBS 122367]
MAPPQSLHHFLAHHLQLALSSISPHSECAICYKPYTPFHLPLQVTGAADCAHVPLGCTHHFGQGCLETWITSGKENSNRCPLCRRVWFTDVELEGVQRALRQIREIRSQAPETLREIYTVQNDLCRWFERYADGAHQRINDLVYAVEELDSVLSSNGLVLSQGPSEGPPMPFLSVFESKYGPIHLPPPNYPSIQGLDTNAIVHRLRYIWYATRSLDAYPRHPRTTTHRGVDLRRYDDSLSAIGARNAQWDTQLQLIIFRHRGWGTPVAEALLAGRDLGMVVEALHGARYVRNRYWGELLEVARRVEWGMLRAGRYRSPVLLARAGEEVLRMEG